MIGYLDTSALVKLLLRDEEDTDVIGSLVAAMDMTFTSRIAYPEGRAALAAARRAGRLTPRDDAMATRDLERTDRLVPDRRAASGTRTSCGRRGRAVRASCSRRRASRVGAGAWRPGHGRRDVGSCAGLGGRRGRARHLTVRVNHPPPRPSRKHRPTSAVRGPRLGSSRMGVAKGTVPGRRTVTFDHGRGRDRDRRRRGGPRDVVRRPPVRRLPRDLLPRPRHRSVPRRGGPGARDLRLAGGSPGRVGGLQGAGAALLTILAASAVVRAYGSSNGASSAVAATMVVTVLCGVVFLVLGWRRLGNVIRFVPYPVVGGFLAGTGWLLFKGGIYVASGSRSTSPHRRPDRAAPPAALAPGVRVRGDPAPGRPDREAAPRDPGGDRDRAGAVRARRARHRLLGREGPRGGVAARTVRDGPAVAAVDVRARSAAPTGWPCWSRGRDRHRGVRHHDRDPVQHQRERDHLGPGPRHERGAA